MSLPEGDDWIEVEQFELDEEGAFRPDLAGDFQILYTDVVAVDHAPLVARSATIIERFPGVSRVVHDDREVVKVWGDVDLDALLEALRDWWRVQLGSTNDDDSAVRG